MTVALGGEMTVTVLPQVHGVTEIVIVMKVTDHHQVIGVGVMTAGVTIAVVRTDGVMIVAATIVVVMTDGVMIVGVTTADATIVDVMNVDAMTVDVMIVIGRWPGEDEIEMSVTVLQGMRGVVIVIEEIGIVMIVTVVTVKETVLEEIEMIVNALDGEVSALMTVIVTVTVILGEVKGTSQAVTSGDENHRLRVLRVRYTSIVNLKEKHVLSFRTRNKTE